MHSASSLVLYETRRRMKLTIATPHTKSTTSHPRVRVFVWQWPGPGCASAITVTVTVRTDIRMLCCCNLRRAAGFNGRRLGGLPDGQAGAGPLAGIINK